MRQAQRNLLLLLVPGSRNCANSWPGLCYSPGDTRKHKPGNKQGEGMFSYAMSPGEYSSQASPETRAPFWFLLPDCVIRLKRVLRPELHSGFSFQTFPLLCLWILMVVVFEAQRRMSRTVRQTS